MGARGGVDLQQKVGKEPHVKQPRCSRQRAASRPEAVKEGSRPTVSVVSALRQQLLIEHKDAEMHMKNASDTETAVCYPELSLLYASLYCDTVL